MGSDEFFVEIKMALDRVRTDRHSLLVFFFLSLISLVSGFYLCEVGTSVSSSGVVWASIFSFFSLLALFAGLKNDAFSPLSMISFLFCLFIPVIYHLMLTDFRSSFALPTWSELERDKLFASALSLSLVGMVSFILGFKISKKFTPDKQDPNIALPSSSSKLMVLLGVIFLAIGFIDFIRVTYVVSGGVVAHFSSLSKGVLQIKSSGISTSAFNFAFWGALILFIESCQKRFRWGSIFPILVAVLVMASLGRITKIAFYLMSFCIVYHYCYRSPETYGKSLKLLGGMLALAATLFFARFFQSYLKTLNPDVGILSVMKEKFSYDWLAHLFIERGNIPNIPVLMQIIDRWEEDIGFLRGQSFLSPILNSIPAKLRIDTISIGKNVKEVWFGDISGGNLPPTGIGELFANFGPSGVPLGLFFLGVASGWMYQKVRLSRNPYLIHMYSCFLLFGIFHFPKGEFADLAGAIWQAVPSALVVFVGINKKSFLVKGDVPEIVVARSE